MKFGLNSLFVVLTLAGVACAFPLVAIAALALSVYIAFVAALLAVIEFSVDSAISLGRRFSRPYARQQPLVPPPDGPPTHSR